MCCLCLFCLHVSVENSFKTVNNSANVSQKKSAKLHYIHVSDASAAVGRKEVSGLSASCPHLEQRPGRRKDINTDYGQALKKQPATNV